MSRREIDIANPLVVGQRVHLTQWCDTDDAGVPSHKDVEGAVTRLVECDTGILMYVRDDAGVTHGAHLQRRFVSAGRVDGVMMDSVDYNVRIVKSVPRQSEMPMLAQRGEA